MITEEQLRLLFDKVEYISIGRKTTICFITLKSGFEIVGSSACVRPEEYNYEIGCSIALTDAMKKLWALEGYHQQIVESNAKWVESLRPNNDESNQKPQHLESRLQKRC